VVTGAGHFLQW